MLVSVLASGSKGNSTLIKTKEYNILIDAGMTVKYLNEKLRENEVLLKDIDYIFITHTHSDHIHALNNMVKRYNPTIIMTNEMFKDLSFLKTYDNILILIDDITLGNVTIETITTSHDTTDARGYIITEDNASVVVITDTGYINRKHFSKLENKNLYVFESNHDVEMLMHGKYPKWLQKRVLGDKGHLSNERAAFYLSKLIGPDTKKIILAHLSEENNREELALGSIKEYFDENNIDFTNITVAKQKEATELFKI